MVHMEAQRLTNGAAVAALREALGIKQVELAARCDISPPFLSNIEAGRKQPGPKTARALADALGCPLSAITYPALSRTAA